MEKSTNVRKFSGALKSTICGAIAYIVAVPKGLANEVNVFAKTRCESGNQAAANFAGKYVLKGCAKAVKVCPKNVISKRHCMKGSRKNDEEAIVRNKLPIKLSQAPVRH